MIWVNCYDIIIEKDCMESAQGKCSLKNVYCV